MTKPWIPLPTDLAAPGFKAQVREPRQWFEFRNTGSDEAEILLFDEVGGWFGIYADEFVEQLNQVTASKITLRVNSPGGAVFQGLAIANALRAHPATVTVRIEGLAASIASVIAIAGDRVVAAPNSMVMIHDASGGCVGPASEMAKMAEILDKISDNIADAYAAKAGGTRAEWRQRMLEETWYTAEEAVEAGLADELLVPPRSDDPDDVTRRMTARWDLSVFRNAPAPAPAAVVATAVGPHETASKEGTWDAGAEEKKLPSPMSVATARAMYGWYDGDQVEDGKVPKSACKLPHHFVNSDGTPGAASVNGVRNALARLPQTQGLTDEERATIERHLRDHLPADEDDHADDPTAAPADQAPASGEPFLPVAASAPVEPGPAPALHVTAPVEPLRAAAGSRTQAPEQPPEWAELVAHLMEPPAQVSADDLLAQLREAT
ncbi:head maturation protease, ClpP-related [Thermoactinospora rubra]|uniref:head maturation protease, ClpP-related n=1 Tax=Thermoactinospora rubra TaxID=1088767 RepID=UPI001301F49A|nr:head maturation protease, ClpP-related [Thermoactinospora rubra]